jgi:alanine dehydrogenase
MIPMKIGVPKEIKTYENRVALTPSGVAALTQAGHQVLVETSAGSACGYPDEQYRRAGAQMTTAAALT